MGGKIDLYYDCVSPWSWFALHHLINNRETLKSYGVEFEIFPVFLGGIMHKSTNTPPWTLPQKASYGTFDLERGQKYFKLSLKRPQNFPILSLLPQRCLTYIKTAYSPEKLEKATLEVWRSMWQKDEDVSKPELMQACLARAFSPADVEKIMKAASTSEVKNGLLATTDKALEQGAYGCPWFEVTNGDGLKQPFFGSDRFHFMYEFLGIPFKDIEIVEKTKANM